MIDKLETSLDKVKADLAADPVEAPSTETKMSTETKTKTKKAAKKVVKAKKAAANGNGHAAAKEGHVTLAQLASEAKITTAGARRKLRGAELERDGRWSWAEGSRALQQARKALGLDA